MEYEKLTKAELIEKLRSLSHLAETVRVKDSMLSELRKEMEKMRAAKEQIESQDLRRLIEENKEIVLENKEAFADLRYVLQVFQGFITNFNNNAKLVQILLQKYLNGGK